MIRTMSSRPRAKARVTEMASKLYCQLKALHKNGSFRSHQFYKSLMTNSFNLFLVYCVLLLGTWLQADFEICVTFPLVLTFEKK